LERSVDDDCDDVGSLVDNVVSGESDGGVAGSSSVDVEGEVVGIPGVFRHELGQGNDSLEVCLDLRILVDTGELQEGWEIDAPLVVWNTDTSDVSGLGLVLLETFSVESLLQSLALGCLEGRGDALPAVSESLDGVGGSRDGRSDVEAQQLGSLGSSDDLKSSHQLVSVVFVELLLVVVGVDQNSFAVERKTERTGSDVVVDDVVSDAESLSVFLGDDNLEACFSLDEVDEGVLEERLLSEGLEDVMRLDSVFLDLESRSNNGHDALKVDPAKLLKEILLNNYRTVSLKILAHSVDGFDAAVGEWGGGSEIVVDHVVDGMWKSAARSEFVGKN